MNETIDTTAVAVRENNAVAQPLSLSEVEQRLNFIKAVMAQRMVEGTDYGKIPGCGDKPGLFQPGAQKLALTFQLAPTVEKEVLRELRNDHREYEFTLAITSAAGRVLAHGVGTCSTLESKYRYRGGSRKCPECGKETIFKGKKDRGGGWYCWAKKGGCGTTWEDGAEEIESQSVERVEHDNPPDFWNTTRKMAFKRALVHGMINATNTSELWSQDLEDRTADDVEVPSEPPKAANPERKAPSAEKCKATFLTRMKDRMIFAWDYAETHGWMLNTERLEDAPASCFPTTAEEYKKIEAEIVKAVEQAKKNGGVSQKLDEQFTAAYVTAADELKI
jgi:hypothetical protein